jgi:hypothetical protein
MAVGVGQQVFQALHLRQAADGPAGPRGGSGWEGEGGEVMRQDQMMTVQAPRSMADDGPGGWSSRSVS